MPSIPPPSIPRAAVALALFAAACGTARASDVESATTTPASRALRVLVYHDMEGLSGQDDWRTFTFRHPEHYARGRELLVGDVNAVVDGLFAGGATVVHVVDAHGSGNPDPDIPPGALDSRATQVFRDRPFRQYVDLVERDAYDAIAVVGMHAKSGSGGFASHTFTLGIDFIINDRSITETELIGYSWGRVDVPVVFASGDDRLAADLATMPWIEYVTVKRATSASTAELKPLAHARAELREGARRSMARFRAGEMRAMPLQPPVRAAVRATPPASLAVLREIPGIAYGDERVDFTAPDFGAAYDGMIALVRVATTAYPRILQELLARTPEGRAMAATYADTLDQRWVDYESGIWRPAAPAATPPRRYHGAR
jgi:D-amino peptidase